MGRGRRARRRGDGTARSAAARRAAGGRHDDAPRARRAAARRTSRTYNAVRPSRRFADGTRAHDRRLGGRRVHAAVASCGRPDSKKIAAYRVTPGYRRMVHYVESSPADQLQPKYMRALLPQAGRRARSASSRCSSTSTHEARSCVDNALFPNAYDMSRIAWRQGQPRVHVRVQSARTSGVSRDRGRRDDGHAARRDHRRVEDVLRLPHGNRRARRFGQAATASTSTTAARSSGCRSATAGTTSICTTARPAQVKNQITKGNWVVRGVERVDDDEAPDLVPRERHEPEAGSVLHPVLPHQLRRHGPDAAHRRRRHAHGHVLAATASTTSTRGRASTSRRCRNCAATSDRQGGDGRSSTATCSALYAAGWQRAGGVRRQGARRHDRHLGRDLPADELRSRRRSIR